MKDETSWVRVKDLSKTYRGGVEALKSVSFSVRGGEAFGLLGPNGAGKTTTIGVLTTTVRATAGEISVGGFDVEREAREARGVSGIVFQDSVVDRAFSGRANLMLHARLWRVPRDRARTRIDDLTDAMGLGEVIDRPVRTYSGGQRRRLEIARAVLAEPRVLFMDEPTVGLDPTIRYELWSLIGDLRTREGVTLVLTTHYLEEAERLCERIAIMDRGRVVAMDRPAALLAGLGEEMLEVDGASELVPQLLGDRGIPVADVFRLGSTITVPFRNGDGDAAVRALRDSKLPIRSISVRRPTLDDVYLRLTGASLKG
ncbi:MAG TPA: ATP-binding cassette domain-containing protein [Actinomycetota bacterium]|nr:ATP-binding cassette domain-containing protein [Actinomycetota bacterium]